MITKQALIVALLALSAFASLHAQRQDTELAADWKFIQQDVPLSTPTGLWTAVSLPHTWNALDAQKGTAGNPGIKGGYYRGACWYARTLDIPANWQGRRVFIRFEAASIVAKTYLNGQLLGEHRGAFTAFCYELTPLLRFGVKNELRVRVDNSPQRDVPPIAGDFNMDGGLYRPAHLIVTDAVCISPLDFASPGVYLGTRSISDTAAEVAVKTIVSNGSGLRLPLRLETRIEDAAGKVVASATQSVQGEAVSTAVSMLTVPSPHRWNGRKDPYLYTSHVRLYRNDAAVDEVVQPLGLRTVAISQPEGFVLNGQPYPIYGVCRHQDRRDRGWALQPADDAQDQRLIMEMGATAVRDAHYPQSQAWHDLADHNGLLLWDEVSNVDMIADTPEYTAGAREELTEMIHQLCNHPSIAFWGIFNEMDHKKTPDPVPLLTQLKSDIRQLDPSRIIVAATDHFDKPYNQIPDALCRNTYPGWYGGKPSDMTGIINRVFKEFGNRRVAVSEYGGGGNPSQHMEGIPSISHGDGFLHPEEYQNVVHEGDYAAIKDNPELWGSFVWAMFDFPAAERKEGGTVGLNDKGIVTQDRQVKKDAFYFYKANWSKEPTVYIAARRLTPRQQATTEVRLYSNCADVRLTVNGKALGPAKKDKVNVFRWQNVTLQPGNNQVEATGQADGKAVSDRCDWVLQAAPVPSPAQGPAPTTPSMFTAYLMAYFGPEEKLFYAFSRDARDWTPLNAGRPVFDAGVRLRDPFLDRVGGTFHLVHTMGWDHPQIGHWTSTDLVHWNGGMVTVVPPEAKCAWAPEFSYLATQKKFYVYWSSMWHGHRVIFYTTTLDWSDLAPARSTVYYDLGVNDIDLTIREHAGTYYAFHKPGKVEDMLGNRLLTSHSLDPQVESFAKGDGPGKDVLPDQSQPTEAPETIQLIGQDRWYVYGDPFHYPMEAWETTDFVGFNKIVVHPPPHGKHCSMIPITEEELKRLQALVPAGPTK